ncbi:MAG TPA: class I SAM-dependent methyltransferase [Salinimicrobium sp.]|nr:class I SAM-dependent methyltransferase [Salinimicrobium sp.]
MESLKRKEHWEHIYTTKNQNEVSWYQPVPQASLDFIRDANLPKDAKIIDVGGGDSLLADYLMDLGYTDISVLDIAAPSLEKAVKRLGKNAEKIKWIIADVTTFQPSEIYDLWHDRAAFHFLNDEKQIESYVQTVNKSLSENGKMVIATFSIDGPKKCSGIEVKQYNELSLNNVFSGFFQKEKFEYIDHETPNGQIQNFLFCRFSKI